MVILILTNAQDALPEKVTTVLESKGAQCIRLNTEEFPRDVVLSYEFDNGRACVRVRGSGLEFDLADVKTVWFRRPKDATPDLRLRPEDQDFVKREVRHGLTALYHCLRGAFWVNPYGAAIAAEHKPYQLQVASALGFDVPRTLISNDPERVRAFAASSSSDLVYKTLTPYSRPREGGIDGIFTNRVTASDVQRQADQVQFGPCIFQDYIDKALELRVTVVGRRVFTSSIDSQSSEHARHDWRRSVKYGAIPHDAADIPSTLKDQILAMLHELGLVFGCFDFVLTPDGRYVFLEINPNGQWYWVEQQTGLPLMDAFTDLLVDGARRLTAAGAH